ncbi:lipase family protein [Calothrix rhizosoleniae]|uniref:lipase family protein n=1 Tax=Calothrix rhizosoleniae TaxID=888997 RepID=UPI000B49E30A|nr:hypothetical protein [Calothrix rhizosoleniae]
MSSSITTIKIPEVLKKGFSFDEAIMLSQMCKRAYAIFPESFGSIDGRDILDSYNATYKHEDWVLVCPLRDFVRGIRGMILKRKDSHHYAIAFRGTVATQQGVIDITNFLSDFNSTLVNYGNLGDLVDQRIKAIQGIQEDYESVEQEILMFFKVLALGKIEPQDWEVLRRQDLEFEQRVATAVSLAAAGGIIFGTEFQAAISDLITQFIKDFESNPLKELGYFKGKAGDQFANIINFDAVANRLQSIETPTFIIDRQNQTIIGRPLKHINVYVGGHSQGAAIADFCALSVKRYLNGFPQTSHRLKSYKIGGIKVGNKAFANYANKTIGLDYSYRVENTLDVGLNMPFTPPFPLDILSKNGLRIGDFYLAEFHHIGTQHTVTGEGSQGLNLDFGGSLRLFGGVPFPHGFDTYIQLLEEQREGIRNLLRPLQGIISEILYEMLAEQQEGIVQAIQRYTTNVDEDISREISNVQETLERQS